MIFVRISLKFVPKGLSNNILALASEICLALTSGETIIWTSEGYINDAYMRHSASAS